MPVLISESALKPVLYTMGIANLVLLTACGYLALIHPDRPSYVPPSDVAKAWFADHEAADVQDVAGYRLPALRPSAVPVAVTRVVPVNAATQASRAPLAQVMPCADDGGRQPQNVRLAMGLPFRNPNYADLPASR